MLNGRRAAAALLVVCAAAGGFAAGRAARPEAAPADPAAPVTLATVAAGPAPAVAKGSRGRHAARPAPQARHADADGIEQRPVVAGADAVPAVPAVAALTAVTALTAVDARPVAAGRSHRRRHHRVGLACPCRPAPRSPATGSRACSATAGWASSTRRRQLSLDRTVALKLLAATLGDDPSFRERFRREGRIQAAHRPPAHRHGLRGGRARRRPVHRDAARARAEPEGPDRRARARRRRGRCASCARSPTRSTPRTRPA